MTTIAKPFFTCTTDNAFRIKIVAEIVSNILKTSFWEIGPDGISLSMFDESRKTMLTIDLKASNFQTYEFNSAESLNIGINSSHFYKMLKSIKKKDIMSLAIDSVDSTELSITMIPKERNRKTVSKIKIQVAQNLEIMNPSGYSKSVIISSPDFQKMIKDLGTLGSDKIIISTRKNAISFSADADGIMARTVSFGDPDAVGPETIYNFSTEQVQRIAKISALCESIHVFPATTDLPIKFTTNIGLLGTICIYIKSDEHLKEDS
jgi:hypothetical protein